MSARRTLFSLAAILLLAGLARGLFPGADSPSTLSWSGGAYADEGFWSYDARNEQVLGASDLDDWSNRRIAPLSHKLSRLAFRLGGVGLAPLRLISMLLSGLGVGLLALGLWRSDGPTTALLASILLGLSYLAAMYGRLFLLETPATLLLVAAYAGLVSQGVPGARLAAGGLAGAALATKSTTVAFVPVAILWLLLERSRGRESWTGLGAFLVGLAGPYGAYRWLVVAPAADAVARYNAFYSSQQGWGLTSTLRNIATQPALIYLSRAPVLLLLVLLGLAGVVAALIRRRDLPPSALLAALWIVGHCALLALFGYRPLRYYTPILPAMAALSALVLSGRLRVQPEKRSGRLLMGLFLVGCALQPGLVVLDRLVLAGRFLEVSLLPEVPWRGGLLLVLLVLVVLTALRRGVRPGREAALATLLLFTAVNAFHFGHWAATREYNVRDTSRRLSEILPSNAVVAGQWAPVLGLENELRTLPLWQGFVNDHRPEERLGITHLLAWKYRLGDEVRHQLVAFPELAGGARTAAIFQIKGTPVFLLEVP